MLTLLLAAALALATPAVAPDPGQHPRPQRNDGRGLLHVDPLYFSLAADTGGDFYFWAPGEFAASHLQIPLHDEAVVLAYGTLDGPRRSFAIPVETGARALTLFAGAQRRDRAVLVRPDGSIVADGAADATLQTYSHMTIATLRDPAPGTWRLDLEGAGLYSVSAHVRPGDAQSTPAFDDFDFVELGGRPGHEGWFPIERDLRVGETIECIAEVSGYATAVQVAFVTRDDRPLATVPMDAAPDERTHYYGHCVIPARPFRVVLTGRDERGLPFRRITSPIRTPR